MIAVIGAGSFGTAIAHCIARNGHIVTLFSRRQDRVISINSIETIPDYPSILRPLTLSATTDINVIANASRIVIALPTQQIRGFLEKYRSMFQNLPVLLLQKGIEKDSGLLPTEITSSYMTGAISVLSGPNFADEILSEMPTATAISSKLESAALEWATLLKSSTFRPYSQTDIIGTQVGGAVKNIIAIACGVVKGLGLGSNAMSAIITRGLAEMVRLGVALGAQKDTFLGLSGIGDLTLTCHSEKSRNLRFGMALAKNEVWDEAMDGTAEGYHTAFSIEKLIQQHQIEMPICECVLKLIRGKLSPEEVVSILMDREIRSEML